MNRPRHISIRRARVHNLKGVDVDIPREKLVVICGPSGSGKSSLAFDTLYAEGQRRYLESLSAYARQFLRRLSKPDVESIEGLSPAIAIERKGASSNPRSTVGTVTEIHDYLRILFARCGTLWCPECGVEVVSHSPQQMVERILKLPAGTRFALLAPVQRRPEQSPARVLRRLRRAGFLRVLLDGEVLDIEQLEESQRQFDMIEVYVDRLVVRKGVRSRLADSLETALALGQGRVRVAVVDGEDLQFTSRHQCLRCGRSFPEPSPRLFSFNSPEGACPRCDGLGQIRQVDPGKIVRPELSLRQGAIDTGHGKTSPYQLQALEALSKQLGFSMDVPFGSLPEETKRIILFGSGERSFEFELSREGMSHRFSRPFEGIVNMLERRYRQTSSDAVRRSIERVMATSTCTACKGSRLRPEALCVKIAGEDIGTLSALDVTSLSRWLDGDLELSGSEAKIAQPLLVEIRSRLEFMREVGIDYLTLDRATATLSGGEAQRVRLASQLGSGLAGVLYVLDEPTIGLHPRDCRRLLGTLLRLRDRGNTVVVVEHDPDTIRSSDHVVEMGPGAGPMGGKVVASGSPGEIIENPRSLTGAWLSGRRRAEPQKKRRRKTGVLRLKGARGRNLKNIDVDIPLGMFTCVTGVSGSGKSTLVVDTLYRYLAKTLHHASEQPLPFDRVEGCELVDRVVHVDQSPIGRTPRSNPATYTGLFTPIRQLFASLPESRMRGWGPGRFSFNNRGGRCEACQGAGQVRVEMHFLPDVYVTCDVCGGRRFEAETLGVRFKGHDIAGVLDLTVAEARELFANHPAIARRLQVMEEVGLGYLRLGQNADTLSGGEAQRVKLASELGASRRGNTMYILDEPTTGLHFEDIERLMEVLWRLVDKGNTVVVIEHNMQVVSRADYVIDLGPEGGAGGGTVVASGMPEQIASSGDGHTARALASWFEQVGNERR